MPIDTLHPEYEAHQGQWKRCRDAAGGSDKVKAAGTDYLPMLGGQANNPGAYEAYKKRGLFLEAMPRTIQGLSGAVFRKQPQIDQRGSTDVQEFLADVSGGNQPIQRFAQCLLDENLEVSRVGVWVTMDAQRSAENRPRLVLVRGENITNWADDGSWVILKETAPDPENDRFEHKRVPQWRYFYLDDLGKLVVELWQENKAASDPGGHDKHVMVDQFFPERVGVRLDFIPVVVVAGTEIGFEVHKPDLLGLADANFHHYRFSTDYAHGLHWTALPTPFLAGVDTKEEILIGSGAAIKASNHQARATMLEFTGQGLTPLKDAIDGVTDYMAALGARLLERSKQAVEAAETIRLRANAEQSAVESMAWAVSAALTTATRWALWWGNMASTPQDESFEIQLNTDLVGAEVDPVMFKNMHDALIAGSASFETWYQYLEKMELTRAGVSAEDEQRQIGEVEDTTFRDAAG